MAKTTNLETAAVQMVRREIETDLEQKHVDSFDQEFRDAAFEFRGRLLAVASINRTLNSKLIEGYMVVEEKKFWKVWGFESFAAYLDSDEVPEFSKSQYYRLKELYALEGPHVFDFFSDRKVSARTRKLLAANQATVEFDGDIVRIGEFEAPMQDRAAIITICDAYNGAFQLLRDENLKLKKGREADQAIIEKGTAEYDELRRNYDSLGEMSRQQRCLSTLTSAFFNLIEAVGELKDEEKAERSAGDLQAITGLFHTLSEAYGVSRTLSDRELTLNLAKPVAEMSDDEKAASFLDRVTPEIMDDVEGLD